MCASLRIAIIEDNTEDLFFLRRVLTQIHPQCELAEFSFVEECLAFLKSPDGKSLDLIFADINTPGKSGFDFVDACQELYPDSKERPKVYVISSSINPDDSMRAELHPVVAGFLRKPITTNDLLAIDINWG